MLWGVAGLTRLGEVNSTHDEGWTYSSRVVLNRAGVNEGSPRTSVGAEMAVVTFRT